jgi:hypothetical protein
MDEGSLETTTERDAVRTKRQVNEKNLNAVQGYDLVRR